MLTKYSEFHCLQWQMKRSSRNVGNDRLVSETFGCKFLFLAIGDSAISGNGRKAFGN